MACGRKRNIPPDQYCNDNEQHQDQDEYRTMNISSAFLHDYPSHHVQNLCGHVQTNCKNADVVLAEASNDHQTFLFTGTNHNQVQEGGPIGLRLRRSESLIKKIEYELSQENQQNNHQEVLSQPHAPPKMKACHFPAVFLKIGSWEWPSLNEGDLMVKFYYGKKKLVWEFLFGALKKKIEIRWTQVSAINAYVDEDKKGRLEIELKETPVYHKECKFQPFKHTQWEKTKNFTDGQANSYRRHTVLFSPGVLDEHFNKLLQYDNRLFNLSRQPFPLHNSQFFNPNMEFSYHVDNHVQPTSSFVEHSGSNLPMPGLTFPNSDEIAMEVSYVNERANGVWEQSGDNQIQEAPLPPITEQDQYELHKRLASVISDLELDLDHVDNNNLAGVTTELNCFKVDSTSKPFKEDSQISFNPLPPIREQDHYAQNQRLQSIISELEQELHHGDNKNLDEVTTDLNCFNVDSTNKPFEQNNQINSNPSGNMTSDGNHHVGQLHTDSGVALTEENHWLPLSDDLNSGGVMNHMAYIDDDVFAAGQFSDVLAMEEQYSWSSSQLSMHGYNSGDSGELPLQGSNSAGGSSN